MHELPVMHLWPSGVRLFERSLDVCLLLEHRLLTQQTDPGQRVSREPSVHLWRCRVLVRERRLGLSLARLTPQEVALRVAHLPARAAKCAG